MSEAFISAHLKYKNDPSGESKESYTRLYSPGKIACQSLDEIFIECNNVIQLMIMPYVINNSNWIPFKFISQSKKKN